jgi:hypothetical protein
MAGGVARRDVQCAAQGDGQVREVAADAGALGKALRRRAVGARAAVVVEPNGLVPARQ